MGEVPSKAMGEALRAAVAADLRPVPPRSVAARSLLVLGGTALAVCLPPVAMFLSGKRPVHDGRALLAAGTVMVLATAAVAFCFSPPGRPHLGPRGKVAALAAVLVAWGAHLVALAAVPSLESAMHGMAFGCAAYSLAAGVLAGGVTVWAFRKADPWTPRRTGALLGAAAGSVAAAGVGLGCHSGEVGHLLVGHGAVIPVLAIGGALLARRALQP